MMATFLPDTSPNFSRMEKASKRACVGCSWVPSPALTTLAFIFLERKWGLPALLWRITTMSTFIARILLTVSIRVSPFLTELFPEEKLITSAESLFSANSKDNRVRVEFSKKTLAMVISLREGTFLIGRLMTSLKLSAVSKISWISSSLMSFIPSKCRVLSCCILVFTYFCNPNCVFFKSIRLPLHAHILAFKGIDLTAVVVRLNGEIPGVFSIDQNHQLHLLRPAKGDHGVHCRTD